MERYTVNSLQVCSIGYDAKLKVLEVEFPDHSVIQYLDFLLRHTLS